MNILAIRKKANTMFFNHYRLLVPAFYMLNCITLIIQITSSGVLALCFSILLVTLNHGFIHMALTLDHGDVKDFSFTDIFIGIKQLTKYLPVYFVRKLVLVSAMLLCMIPAFGILYNIAGADFYNVFDNLMYLLFSDSFRIDMIVVFITQYFSWLALIFVFIGFGAYLYLSGIFILAPCIVEDYDYAWNEALHKSAQLMKGHLKDFIRLLITFVPNFIVYCAVSFLVMIVCQFLPIGGMSVYLVISMLLRITTYQVSYYQAVSLFYLELREQSRNANSYELFKI